MSIRIAARFHPFSHLPGTVCLLPLTSLKMRIFPARLEFFRCGDSTPLFHLTLDVKGPVEEFTVELDLEQQQVRVFGRTARGYLRYLLKRHVEGVSLVAERVPQESLTCHLPLESRSVELQAKEMLLIPWSWNETAPASPQERLSLGMHKLQDWEGMKRRCDFQEIFPVWMRMGQSAPSREISSREGNFFLLEQCRTAIREKRKTEILDAFKRLFLAGFEGIFVPRSFDTEYQGILPLKPEQDLSPLALLTEGAKLIRSLFISEEKEWLEILPALPPDFHAGRFLEIYSHAGDRIEMEWTKKQLRRLIIHPVSDRPIYLKLPASLKRCRVRHALKERGKEEVIKEGMLLASGKSKQCVIIDRFQK